MTTLGQAQVGDKIKLSERGCLWTVIHKTSRRCGMNATIALENDKATTRVYHDRQDKWTAPIWPPSLPTLAQAHFDRLGGALD